MATKRQITMAKIAREQALRERRTRKQDKKDARRAAQEAASGGDARAPAATDETTGDDPTGHAMG